MVDWKPSKSMAKTPRIIDASEAREWTQGDESLRYGLMHGCLCSGSVVVNVLRPPVPTVVLLLRPVPLPSGCVGKVQ